VTRFARAAAVAALAAAAAPGCGPYQPPTYPVSGKVVFHDGHPVPGGVIEFAPVGGGPAARGKIGSDGHFTLATGDRPGAVAGEHQVAIVPAVMAGGLPPEAAAHAVQHKAAVVHRKYARFETSGLTRRVEPDKNNEFVIEVDAVDWGAGWRR